MYIPGDQWEQVIYIEISTGSKFIILVLYTDDTLLTTSDLSLLHETKDYFIENFKMKDMGKDEASFVLGIEIFRDRSRGLLGLSLKAHINRVLEIFNMENCFGGKASIYKLKRSIL